MKKSTIILLTFILSQTIFSQEIKFGKVSKDELAEKFYTMDSSANAAVLYKKRSTHYEYSGQEGWKLITKIHQRIKLYNKEGFDWATKKIGLYDGRNGEEKVSIKAYTFNLKNGKIEKTKLQKSEIFKEEVSENWKSRKFTMPNLAEGSVVEWEYTVNSPYYSNIDEVIFQYKIPMKYMVSRIKIPEYFRFKYLPNLYYPVKVNISEKLRKYNFSYRESANDLGGARTIRTTAKNASVDLQEKIYESVEKNIPALKEESFVNNIDNYRSKVTFEFTAYTPKNGIPKYYNNTWKDVTKTINDHSKFGDQLNKAPFKEDISTLISSGTSNEKMAKIFEFVKSKIKWNENYGKYTDNGVKKAYKEGVGNDADINLTLVAMLRNAGLKANPVLVSTRDNGIPLFPTSEGFNYVIACVESPQGNFLLDATERYSLPNILPLRTLNWQGRLVRNDGTSEAINLFPQKASKENTFISANIDEDGLITGMKRTTTTNLLAQIFRNKNGNVSDEDIMNNIEKEYNIEISEMKISNKKDPYKPLVEIIKFEGEDFIEIVGDKMYIDPLLFLTEKNNPFKLAQRNFPVDFGTPWEDMVRAIIKIPEGYKLESVPEKAGLAMPENLGVFRFIVSEKDNQIQVSYSMKLNAPIIPVHYYQNLKAFYDKILQKQSEKIILTKI